jgi:hypothetical protein
MKAVFKILKNISEVLILLVSKIFVDVMSISWTSSHAVSASVLHPEQDYCDDSNSDSTAKTNEASHEPCMIQRTWRSAEDDGANDIADT